MISMNGDKQAFQGSLAMNGNHTQVRGLRDHQDCRVRDRTARRLLAWLVLVCFNLYYIDHNRCAIDKHTK